MFEDARWVQLHGNEVSLRWRVLRRWLPMREKFDVGDPISSVLQPIQMLYRVLPGDPEEAWPTFSTTNAVEVQWPSIDRMVLWSTFVLLDSEYDLLCSGVLHANVTPRGALFTIPKGEIVVHLKPA